MHKFLLCSLPLVLFCNLAWSYTTYYRSRPYYRRSPRTVIIHHDSGLGFGAVLAAGAALSQPRTVYVQPDTVVQQVPAPVVLQSQPSSGMGGFSLFLMLLFLGGLGYFFVKLRSTENKLT
jgi:hypothetical protein